MVFFKDKIQVISKMQIAFKDKARAGSAELAAGHEKAQSR